MTLYLDASVIVPLVVDQPTTTLIADFLAGQPAPPIIGDFAAGEVASAVSRLVRMGFLAAGEAADQLLEFDAWRASDSIPDATQSADIRVAATFVRRFDLGLRLPDAVHLACCRRLSARLVTRDERLERAAHALGIAVTNPS